MSFKFPDNRDQLIVMAKLAEQSERYDEMLVAMKKVVKASADLSGEERNLLSVAYKNAVGSRRAAWRIITSVQQKETSKGNTENAANATEYSKKVKPADVCMIRDSQISSILIGPPKEVEVIDFLLKNRCQSNVISCH